MENIKRVTDFDTAIGNVDNNGRECSAREEFMHALTHGIGAILSLVGLVFLIVKAWGSDALSLFSVALYGISLFILYSSSCAYHISCAVFGTDKSSRIRDFFMKCDHSMIFFLILGTYTPACLISMRGMVGFSVFAVVAISCILGIILNVINVERYYKISQLLYLVTGWTIVLALRPYCTAIGGVGVGYLVLGGILYTVGVLFYNMKRIPGMHVVWHLFVILGSIMHFIMIYSFCI